LPRISERKLAEIIVKAAREASIDCDQHNLSAKQVGQLNEQWIQSYVGDAISRHLRDFYKSDGQRPYVTYETTAGWIRYFFDQKNAPVRRHVKLTEKSRFDLTVWSKSGKIVGLIEIKNEPLMSGYSKSRDPDKIISALHEWDYLNWGIFLFCSRNNTQKTGEKLNDHLYAMVDKTFSHVERHFGRHADLNLVTSELFEGDDAQCLWAAVIMKWKS